MQETTIIIPTLPQHRLGQVSRYLLHIRNAIANYPTCINVKPIGIAPITFVARCRDAINAIEKYPTVYQDWTDTERNKMKDLTVSHTTKGVLIGPRGSMRHYKPIEDKVVPGIATNEIEVFGDEETIHQLCTLLNRECFKPQPTFITSIQLSEPEWTYLQAMRPNVLITVDSIDPTKHRIC